MTKRKNSYDDFEDRNSARKQKASFKKYLEQLREEDLDEIYSEPDEDVSDE